MIFFGDPNSLGVDQDARKCVEMAVAMQKKMNELAGFWSKSFGLKNDLQTNENCNLYKKLNELNHLIFYYLQLQYV